MTTTSLLHKLQEFSKLVNSQETHMCCHSKGTAGHEHVHCLAPLYSER